MPPPQGRRAKALVRLGVILVPDAQAAQIEQAHDTGDGALAGERAAGQIVRDPLAHKRQRLAEGETAIEFLAILMAAEIGVIAILLAPARIDPRRQYVPVRRRTIPRIGIGWRQRHRIQPVDLGPILDCATRP